MKKKRGRRKNIEVVKDFNEIYNANNEYSNFNLIYDTGKTKMSKQFYSKYHADLHVHSKADYDFLTSLFEKRRLILSEIKKLKDEIDFTMRMELFVRHNTLEDVNKFI